MSGVAGIGAVDPNTLTRRVRASLDEALEPFLPKDAGGTPSRPENASGGDDDSGAYFSFTFGGVRYRVNLWEIQTLFTLGSIVMSQAFDPRLNPQVELYGLPSGIREYVLSLKVLRPGRYDYQLNLIADVAYLQDYAYDSSAPGNLTGQTPGGGPFTGANAVKTFQTRPIPAQAYQNVSGFFDNESNQSATYNILGTYDPNGGVTAILSTGTVSASTVKADGADLTKIIVPYIILQFTFASAPTTGFVRMVPYAKRGT